jgi:hypothetical protein
MSQLALQLQDKTYKLNLRLKTNLFENIMTFPENKFNREV